MRNEVGLCPDARMWHENSRPPNGPSDAAAQVLDVVKNGDFGPPHMLVLCNGNHIEGYIYRWEMYDLSLWNSVCVLVKKRKLRVSAMHSHPFETSVRNMFTCMLGHLREQPSRMYQSLLLEAYVRLQKWNENCTRVLSFRVHVCCFAIVWGKERDIHDCINAFYQGVSFLYYHSHATIIPLCTII